MTKMDIYSKMLDRSYTPTAEEFNKVMHEHVEYEKLLKLQKQLKIDKNVDLAIENMKPKIFWKDKPIYTRQIQKWKMNLKIWKWEKDKKQMH